MGAACCVAAKDGTVVTNGSTGDSLQRNIRHSPSWSFRWDNRVRVVGDEGSLNWASDGSTRNNLSDIKAGSTIETAYASEGGSPLDSQRSLVWQKSPASELNHGIRKLPTSDS